MAAHRVVAALLLLAAVDALVPRPTRLPLRRRRAAASVAMMGRKFENNKLKMAKTAAAYTKKASLIGKKIKVAVRAGGPDPNSNRALGLVIKEAQALNVKREIVDRNIKAASGDKDGADFKELTYELYGHGGVGVVVNALSDNNNRARVPPASRARARGRRATRAPRQVHGRRDRLQEGVAQARRDGVRAPQLRAQGPHHGQRRDRRGTARARARPPKKTAPP